MANRRGAGKRWVLLRAAAEAVKSEIYRYRTRTGVYSGEALRNCDEPADRPGRLAGRLTEIDGGLNLTAASGGPLTPYDGKLPPKMYGAEADDDGFKRLTAEEYVELRVADQLRLLPRQGRLARCPAGAPAARDPRRRAVPARCSRPSASRSGSA